jgi:hypothetical protein
MREVIFMLMENPDFFYYGAMAFTLAFLIKKFSRSDGTAATSRFFYNPFKKSFTRKQELGVLAFKKCPQCDEQLPVSTLVCDACDYNFLASSILRHKLLPAPAESIAGVAQQSFAYRA